MNPINVLCVIIFFVHFLPVRAWGSDTPDPGQDLTPEQILEIFGNQGDVDDQPSTEFVPDSLPMQTDDTFFETNAPNVAADQLRQQVQSAGTLRERTGTQTGFMQNTSSDQYRLRQQVQDLQRYLREQNNRNYELPTDSQPYSVPEEPLSQEP